MNKINNLQTKRTF